MSLATSFMALPPEVVQHTLSFIEQKELLGTHRVSKTWNKHSVTVASDKKYIQAQNERIQQILNEIPTHIAANMSDKLIEAKHLKKLLLLSSKNWTSLNPQKETLNLSKFLISNHVELIEKIVDNLSAQSLRNTTLYKNALHLNEDERQPMHNEIKKTISYFNLFSSLLAPNMKAIQPTEVSIALLMRLDHGCRALKASVELLVRTGCDCNTDCR